VTSCRSVVPRCYIHYLFHQPRDDAAVRETKAISELLLVVVVEGVSPRKQDEFTRRENVVREIANSANESSAILVDRAVNRALNLGHGLALASTPPGMPGTHPQYFGWGGHQREYPPPILLRTFGYSRPILVAIRSLSLKPISFGYKTPPIRFSQAGGQSAHKARPPPRP